ncbi:hypothetical protein I5Q34_02610 [Streptomyces sp. AV19]|uniref:hypothetical protein n=1 Tax=Streptomyces sp. AV19 TaxID=2793068 RepID=UPI0018FE2009|nr:hypothetical protein [Streptomyces sp. AV19]MBH1933188.1 hypothetical protein [Streptomyces sp. AV19]MDG4531906.1 hypothetical protein [Streptomyces sp. AV19]
MHVHGYLWAGDKTTFDKESNRRPPPSSAPTSTSPAEVTERYREAVAEWNTAGVPPIETAYWLQKPARFIRDTWDEPEKAADWIRRQLAAYAPRFASGYDRDASRMAALATSAAERLALGGDVSLGFYLGRPLFLSLALVTCSPNRTVPEQPCPMPGDGDQ